MLLSAVVTRDELARVVESLTPLRVDIGAQRGRSIEVGRPRSELVAGRGLRLRGDARLTWDVVGLEIPITVQAWQIMLRPRVVERGRARVLLFEPSIEALDLKLVPSVVDAKIADAIESGIAAGRDRLAWSFTRTLARSFALPARMKVASGATSFALLPVADEVVVTESEVRLSLRLEASVEKRPPAAVDPAGRAQTAPRGA